MPDSMRHLLEAAVDLPQWCVHGVVALRMPNHHVLCLADLYPLAVQQQQQQHVLDLLDTADVLTCLQCPVFCCVLQVD